MTRLCRQANMKKYKKRAFILAVLMIILSVFDFFTSSASAVASHSTRLNLYSNVKTLSRRVAVSDFIIA